MLPLQQRSTQAHKTCDQDHSRQDLLTPRSYVADYALDSASSNESLASPKVPPAKGMDSPECCPNSPLYSPRSPCSNDSEYHADLDETMPATVDESNDRRSRTLFPPLNPIDGDVYISGKALARRELIPTNKVFPLHQPMPLRTNHSEPGEDFHQTYTRRYLWPKVSPGVEPSWTSWTSWVHSVADSKRQGYEEYEKTNMRGNIDTANKINICNPLSIRGLGDNPVTKGKELLDERDQEMITPPLSGSKSNALRTGWASPYGHGWSSDDSQGECFKTQPIRGSLRNAPTPPAICSYPGGTKNNRSPFSDIPENPSQELVTVEPRESIGRSRTYWRRPYSQDYRSSSTLSGSSSPAGPLLQYEPWKQETNFGDQDGIMDDRMLQLPETHRWEAPRGIYINQSDSHKRESSPKMEESEVGVCRDMLERNIQMSMGERKKYESRELEERNATIQHMQSTIRELREENGNFRAELWKLKRENLELTRDIARMQGMEEMMKRVTEELLGKVRDSVDRDRDIETMEELLWDKGKAIKALREETEQQDMIIRKMKKKLKRKRREVKMMKGEIFVRKSCRNVAG